MKRSLLKIFPRRKTKGSSDTASCESVSNGDHPIHPVDDLSVSHVQEALPANCPYECIKYIGRGSYGFVILAQHMKTHRMYALKFIERDEKRTQYIEAEVLNHMRIRHPHVIKVYEIFMSGSHVVMVLEYANRGTLLSRLVSTVAKHNAHGIQPLGMSESRARWYFQQLICAVDCCHKLGIVNRDIKMDNILLCGTGEHGHQDIIKLTDFGLSKDENAQSAPNTCLGTVVYFAPEIIRVIVDSNKEYDARKSDVWSSGIVLYAMICGAFPFSEGAEKSSDPTYRLLGIGSPKHLQATLDNMMSKSFARIEGISEGCAELIDGLLEPDPSKRLSIEQIIHHPWFKEDLRADLGAFNDKIVVNVNRTEKGAKRMAVDFTHALKQLSKDSNTPSIRPMRLWGSLEADTKSNRDTT